MADLKDADINAALERGRIAHLVEPRATAARYDRKSARIIVELNNGCTFAFPPHLAQGLETGTDDELAAVEILGVGFGLHWEALDADFRVSGLLAGVFGTQAYMARHVARKGRRCPREWCQRWATEEAGIAETNAVSQLAGIRDEAQHVYLAN